MRYRPARSVMVVRVFSISASLVASTATPGTGAPDGSLTEPAIAACAKAAAGMPTNHARMPSVFIIDRLLQSAPIFVFELGPKLSEVAAFDAVRSEERRVGIVCRSG